MSCSGRRAGPGGRRTTGLLPAAARCLWVNGPDLPTIVVMVDDAGRIAAVTINEDSSTGGRNRGRLPVRSFAEGSRFVPPVEAPKRVPRRSTTRWLSCANVVEAQGESPGRDTAQNCSSYAYGQLLIAADLPVYDRQD